MEEQKDLNEHGELKVKKSFFRSLFSGDVADIWDGLRDNVAVPSVKKLMYDLVCNGADVLFYGKSVSHGNPQVTTKTPYSRISTSRTGTTFTSVPATSHDSSGPISINRDYEHLVFSRYADAHEVLDNLNEVIDQNNYARLSDLYYILNKMFKDEDKNVVVAKSTYTDQYYGWYSLGEAKIEDVPNGWWLRLPKVTALK